MTLHRTPTRPARRRPGHATPLALTLTRALALAAAALAVPARADDRAELDRTQIIGSRELPKVLYIVPWKKPLPVETSVRPPASVIDEALAPLDRDVFRRQMQYDALVQSRAAPAAAPAGTAANPSAARP